ncbi:MULTISPECIES: methylmalonyl-CoA mutase small subunit [unclassified Rhodococcus (in: high G+C Gram-positive bacteria)]|uniref:methylmalonyl-CoA mutase small subunit n=1 Tax=unclassified Rhodococcus (in: high G+C Gram-positive bacteria) TaxID=192944 RepID=UPI0015839F8C|nr:methylmalonyl-CoA mutase small subunit [Rhodococcus sp. W8901]QKT11493.1 methylmalonyl-CoA mutase small subunit [Rhodococcus sp. W8901]
MSPASEAEDAARAYSEWQQAVAGVLAKSRRVDAAELGPEPQKLLETTTYDGVTISPLYTGRDELPESPLPGQFPFVRGTDASRDVNAGWLVSAQFGQDTQNAAEVNRAILDGLENGVSAVRLSLGGQNLPVAALDLALTGVLLDLAPLTLDAGADTAAAAQQLFALLDQRATAGDGVTDRAQVRAGLGASPLTDAFAGAAGVELSDAVSLAETAAGRDESIRAITVDGTAFHNAGASDAEELGAAVAAGVEYLRALTNAGLTISAALGQLEFRLAATDDQFQTIAKFRAGRQVWARVAQVCGASEFGGAVQHAVTSAAMMAQRDPWVNMLRTTLAAFGAGVGGADSVTVLPFDVALPAGAAGVSKSFSARIARNTQLLLLEESHLGRVLDPGAGSWYVEDLTEEIAAKAWEFFQQIETVGGYSAAIGSGVIGDRIAATKAARDSDIAHRKTAVTGVNEFPNLAEAPLPAGAAEAGATVARYAAAFESLRDRSDAFLAANGARPQVFLAPLGPVSEHNGRSTFASNLLASGGIEAINPGPLDAGDGSIAPAVKESGARIAVLCGTDKRYAEQGAAAVAALREAGIEQVLLAGPEKIFADVEGAQRPDGFLTARIDAVTALSGLLDAIGGDNK